MAEGNRRDLRRYGLKALAVVKSEQGPVGESLCSALVRDISERGAFIETQCPLAVDTSVKVKILFNAEELENMFFNGPVQLQAHGTILRSESSGMAIKFSDHCEIVAFG